MTEGTIDEPTAAEAPGVEFHWPSDDFPNFPGLALEAPAGWEAERRTGAAMLVYDTDSPAHFRTNALVTVERVPVTAELQDLVRASAQELGATQREYRVLFARTAAVAGQPAVVRVQTWEVDELSVPVFQVEVLLFAPAAPDRPTKDLVQLHATCGADQAERYAPAFEQLVGSLRFTGSS